MKTLHKSIVVVLFLLLVANASGQTPEHPKKQIPKAAVDTLETLPDEYPARMGPYSTAGRASEIVSPEVQASFPEGDSALLEYLKKGGLDTIACMKARPAEITFRFIVDAGGNLSNIQIVNDTANCEALRKEARRILQSLPRWIPAQSKGRFVSSYRLVHLKLARDE